VRHLIENYKKNDKKLCIVFIVRQKAKRNFKVDLNEKKSSNKVFKFDTGYVCNQ